ncbi:MAG TPA: FG-GAP-like repeat-containing protein [Vicinamibacterales bacterium]|nr:FG-GAP-like repeat-containing protein [Vicinamibacterales bacterium]
MKPPRKPRTRRLLIVGLLSACAVFRGTAQEQADYRPKLAVSEAAAPFLKQLEPGNDGFPLERQAAELDARLRELSEALRAGGDRAAGVTTGLLDPGFRGARLIPLEAAEASQAPLDVKRAKDLPRDPTLDARAFAVELRRLMDDIRDVATAEFLITAIEPEGSADPPSGLRTTVRYDIVGAGTTASRVEHVGEWEMGWRRNASGWQVVRWTAASHVVSRARQPIFTEITVAALGGNDSFRRQLNLDLDSWMATVDSVLTRDSNGHQGVSVGDVDGDGLDDLYVAQPAGLPNRLYRNRGDSTFEDITDQAGVGVLDDTAQSLFVDVDNDGDQDLVVATSTNLLLFVNDGKGHFTRVQDAFRLARPLQGVLTSIAAADYDRDGFLDLYVCVYSYFFGAGEDKAGTPAPYYDARNGPPAVLFRNDGHGRFVDATADAGLDAGNDRYHFAAAWGDYDGDGWPDLLVANDFGTKNLYHNLGRRDGKVRFEDVAAAAGVLDHGAGMSATFLDYDNDGLLDIYTGNMWSAPGLRVTSAPAFMRDATPEVRALYRRHVRGNTLLRNLGNGRFEDTTLEAHAEMGRWAWSSDAIDFDSDGWDDLYIVNGMLTRKTDAAGGPDLEGFFWRQVVARSPLTRVPGTPYDDAWRAINQLLVHGSIASRQRNVFLRNDGHGGYDEISGTLGLDLDQDGRSFAVLDIDGDGDPDLVVMADRQAPQLRIFRNDFEAKAASIAVRLRGTTSNRDAIGARVTVETDRLHKVKIVQGGSGFLSQHSKELLIGLGASERILKLTVSWPSGNTQVFTDVPLNARLRIVEGSGIETEAFKPRSAATPTSPLPAPASAPRATWMYEPFPAPDFSLPDLAGGTRSVAALRGKPAIVLLWSFEVAAARTALETLGRGAEALSRAGVGSIAIAVDPPQDQASLRTLSSGQTAVVMATPEVSLSYAILNRHLFMNQQNLRLPTGLLLDSSGNVVKVYRDRVDVDQIVMDASRIDVSQAERLARALPFQGMFYSGLPRRNYLPYGRELLDGGLERAAVVAFERAAEASPGAPTLYRLGTLLVRSGEAVRARAAFERALALQPDLAEANNDLGALLAQGGDLDAAISRFRAALASTPEYPDALNNLGYALLLTGHDQEARALYEKALALQPDFPEVLNNLGLLFGRAGDMDRAERYFRDALGRRPDYGEAANNLALVFVSRGQADAAVGLLQTVLKRTPQYEAAYVTLAKIHFSAGRSKEGIAVLEQLLQTNPRHAVALELLRQWKGR